MIMVTQLNQILYVESARIATGYGFKWPLQRSTYANKNTMRKASKLSLHPIFRALGRGLPSSIYSQSGERFVQASDDNWCVRVCVCLE